MAGTATCPECCGDCLVDEDKFDRAALGGDWVVQSGDWQIVNNALKATAAGLVLHDAEQFANLQRRITFTFVPRSDDTVFRFVVVDALSGSAPSHGWIVEFTTSPPATPPENTCDGMQLAEYVLVPLQELQPVRWLRKDEEHFVEVCWIPSSYPEESTLRVKVRTANGRTYGTSVTWPWQPSAAGNFGFELMLGSVEIDDLRYYRYDPDECPNCNTPCLVEDDAFSRGDSTNTGCIWNELSGIWQIVSQELQMVSGAPGTILCKVHHQQAKTHHRVAVDVFLDTGTIHRILVNSTVDASSHHWIEASLSGGIVTVRVGKDGAVLSTGTQVGTSGWHTLYGCYDGSSVAGSINLRGQPEGTGTSVSAVSTEIADGVFVGLYGGTGGERFDNFEFHKHYSPIDDPVDLTCPNCPQLVSDCTGCEDGEGPLFFLVRLSGVVDLLDSCPHNVTVLCQKTPIGLLPACNGFISVTDPGDCMWTGTIDVGGGSVATVCVYLRAAGQLYVTVGQDDILAPCSGQYRFISDAVIRDCLNMVDFNVPNMETVAAGCCDYTAAVCLLSSLP